MKKTYTITSVIKLASAQLIYSINREEQLIQRKIDKSQIEIKKKETFLKSIQSKLKENLIYIYKNGVPTFIESILILDDLSSIPFFLLCAGVI